MTATTSNNSPTPLLCVVLSLTAWSSVNGYTSTVAVTPSSFRRSLIPPHHRRYQPAFAALSSGEEDTSGWNQTETRQESTSDRAASLYDLGLGKNAPVAGKKHHHNVSDGSLDEDRGSHWIFVPPVRDNDDHTKKGVGGLKNDLAHKIRRPPFSRTKDDSKQQHTVQKKKSFPSTNATLKRYNLGLGKNFSLRQVLSTRNKSFISGDDESKFLSLAVWQDDDESDTSANDSTTSSQNKKEDTTGSTAETTKNAGSVQKLKRDRNGSTLVNIYPKDEYDDLESAIDHVPDPMVVMSQNANWKPQDDKSTATEADTGSDVHSKESRPLPSSSEKNENCSPKSLFYNGGVNGLEASSPPIRYQDIDLSIPPPVYDNRNRTTGACVDLVWELMRYEAKREAEREPLLVSFLYSTILNHPSLESSLAFHLANLLSSPAMISTQIMNLVKEALDNCPVFRQSLRADILAVRDRDPACTCLPDVFLYYKGFHALQTHRLAHYLWNDGRQVLAHYLQSQVSQNFQIDIHPNATLGSGIMLDHGSGIVIGETATVGHNCSILHHVTLGGSGKKGVERHPKVGNGVLLGAGASVLGNVRLGDGCQVGAGTLVIGDLPPYSVAVGVPAKIIGTFVDSSKQPSISMNQVGSKESEESIVIFGSQGI